MPHGSSGYFVVSYCGRFGLSAPFMMSRIEKDTVSLPVSGMLKSMTALEYLFHTITWAITPGVDTLTIDTRVSVPPVPIGKSVAPLSDTLKYGTRSVAAGTLSYEQVTAYPVPATAS